ncbi:helix-turn-helix transcriptional regulator [Thermopolyspora sp. NPDC052614]|uniref:helix-turn-helix domain-containing protein n=1 Tax=Thermopolyspora sp. NPDC052614 TaxID=3155682 RepID=UPI0034352F15
MKSGGDEYGEDAGRRIAHWRKVRGLTQSGLARQAHVSRSLIAQVEAGHKPATPSLVAAVATALEVDPAQIFGRPYRREGVRSDGVHGAISGIRKALTYGHLAPDTVPPRSLDALDDELAVSQQLQGAAQHVRLGARLPAIIEELTVHAMETDLPRAWRLLNHADAIAASLARRMGYLDLAQVAVERAAIAAQRAEDPLLPQLVVLTRALLLLSFGLQETALAMVEKAVDEVDPDDGDGLAVFGALHLRASVAAARAGRAQSAWEHHGVAEDVAREVTRRDGDQHDPYGLQVTAGNVAMHGCAIAIELGDYDRAFRMDERINLSPRLWAERRAHHEIDMARALLWVGRYKSALDRILKAEKIAPQMARHHPTSRETVMQLDRVYRTLPESLRALEHRMGF